MSRPTRIRNLRVMFDEGRSSLLLDCKADSVEVTFPRRDHETGNMQPGIVIVEAKTQNCIHSRGLLVGMVGRLSVCVNGKTDHLDAAIMVTHDRCAGTTPDLIHGRETYHFRYWSKGPSLDALKENIPMKPRIIYPTTDHKVVAKAMPTDPGMLTSRQVQARLAGAGIPLCTYTIRKRIASGEIKATRTPYRLLVKESDLKAYIAKQTVKLTGKHRGRK